MAESKGGEPQREAAPRQGVPLWQWLGVVVAIISVGVGVGVLTNSLHSGTRADVRELRSEVTSVGQSVASLEAKVGSANHSLASLDGRLDGFGERINGFGERLASVEGRLKIWAELAEADVVATSEAPMVKEDELAADEIRTVSEVVMVPSAEEDAAVDVVAMAGDYSYEEAGPVIAPPEDVPDAGLNSDEGIIAFLVVKATDSSLRDVRERITLEIDVGEGIDPLSSMAIKAMMLAARMRHKDSNLDAVLVRVWQPYEDGGNALNRIVYAPDGCGWAGTNCTGEVWTELLAGELP